MRAVLGAEEEGALDERRSTMLMLDSDRSAWDQVGK